MRVIRGILSTIITIAIFCCIFVLSASYSTSYIIKNEILSGNLKDKIVDEYIKTDDQEKKEVLKEILDLEDSIDLIDETINEFINYANNGKYESKDKLIDNIINFAIKNKALIERLSGEKYTEEQLRSEKVRNDISKALDDEFEEATDKMEVEAKDVIKVYGLFISKTVRFMIIIAIIALILVLMLINWSFISWMNYFGTSVIISGSLFTILYILSTILMDKLLEVLDITTTINLTILLLVGLGELFIGVMFIVIKSLFTKENKKLTE